MVCRVVFGCLLPWRFWGGWPRDERSLEGCRCYCEVMGCWDPCKLNACLLCDVKLVGLLAAILVEFLGNKSWILLHGDAYCVI